MKKTIYYITLLVVGLTAFGCSEDLLDTENLYGKSLETFYATPTDIEEAMSGVYNAMFVAEARAFEPLAANLLSDQMLGGGDNAGDVLARSLDAGEDPTDDTYRDLWVQSYRGIARCNAILSKAPGSDFSTFFASQAEATAFVDEAVGEAHFMRAFYYFKLAKFFGGVPLMIEVGQPIDIPRNTYEETFAQIASDLKIAIEMMASTNFNSIPTARNGRANKWVAQAYLGRVFLHYTGYMTNIEGQSTTALPLPDGGSISSSDVAGHLVDCRDNSGYQLTPDFRNIWPYSYINTAAGSTVLPWAANENLAWIGQDGHSPTFGTGNYETMFMQRFSFGDWGWGNQFNSSGQSYNNRLCLFTAIRDNQMVPFGQGWGYCPVNPNLWTSWDVTDPRREGTILETGNADQGTDGYVGGFGNQETGLYNKKYISLVYDVDGVQTGMFVDLYDWGNNDMQLRHAQDFIFMRFSDVLLMHSEVTGTADGLNAVRNRVGLAPVAYSLDAIKDERKHEFAFEGLRWFDLVRWGDVNTAYNYTVPVSNYGVAGNYTASYRPETKGLLTIPETEVSLSNGVYDQNPGW